MPGPPAVSLTSAGLGGGHRERPRQDPRPQGTCALSPQVARCWRNAGRCWPAWELRATRTTGTGKCSPGCITELCSLVGHRKQPCAGLGGQGRSCSLTQGTGLTSSSHSLAGVGRGGQWGQEPYVATGQTTGQEQRGQASLDTEKGSWESSSPSFQGTIAQGMLTVTLRG